MSLCTQLLREPWKNVIEISPLLERIETNTQFAQIIAPNEMIAIVTLNVKLGDVDGFMNVCLPYVTIESIIDNLNTKFWFTNMTTIEAEDQTELLEAMLRRVDVPVKAVLGKSSIAVGDFLGLQLGKRTDEELDIYVGDIKKFTAVTGTEHDSYAAKITSIIREEEE